VPGKLVGRDPATDLAVVKIDMAGLPSAKLADSDAARVGEWVVAIGSPFGLGYSVTSGVLSAKGRGGIGANAIEDYLQTDASINPGNSGGPLCNLDGQVVGINSMIVGRGTGIGFAVPSNIAKRVGEQILKTGHVQRAWIGVGYQDLTPELATAMKVAAGSGALINSIADASPAAKAAIKSGDIIASVAGKPVHGGHELIREILAHDVGQQIQLEIVRDGKHYGTNVVLAARPEPAVAPVPAQQAVIPQSGMGLAVRDVGPQQAQQMGLAAKAVAVVTTVQPGSAADRAGIKSGDVVAEADGVADPNSAQIQQQAADGTLLLRMRRGDGAFYAVIRR
jgi:S1-C subfamily serine protease